MRVFVLLLAALAALFLILATLSAAGLATLQGAGWLLPAGLATWAVAWFCSLIAPFVPRP